MTFDELVAVARNRGLVKWTNSGVVENLLVRKKQKGKRHVVLAYGRYTKIHYVCTVEQPKSQDYHCIPLPSSTDPRVGSKEEQREAARNTPWFKAPEAKKSMKP